MRSYTDKQGRRLNHWFRLATSSLVSAPLAAAGLEDVLVRLRGLLVVFRLGHALLQLLLTTELVEPLIYERPDAVFVRIHLTFTLVRAATGAVKLALRSARDRADSAILVNHALPA